MWSESKVATKKLHNTINTYQQFSMKVHGISISKIIKDLDLTSIVSNLFWIGPGGEPDYWAKHNKSIGITLTSQQVMYEAVSPVTP